MSNTSASLIPGNEIVGLGVNVVGAVYSTANVPVGGLCNRIYNLGSPSDGQQWTFAGSNTTYIIPPGLETPSGGNVTASTQTSMSRSDFSESFNASVNISGRYEGFSAQLAATYGSTYENDQEYAYAYVVQDGVTWGIRLNDSVATLEQDFIDAVNALPETFDKTDPDNAPLFYGFFDVWGTHFIVQASVGGRLYYYTAVEKSYGMSSTDISANLSAEWQGLIASAQVSSQAAWSEVSENWMESRETFLVSVGPGSQQIDIGSFLSPSQSTWLGADVLTDWETSVNDGPGSVGATLSDITVAVHDVAGVTTKKIEQIKAASAMYGEKHIHVVTSTNDEYAAGKTTSVIVDGTAVDFSNEPSQSALCGLMAVVLDRSTLETRLAKFYDATDVSNLNIILNWDFQNNFRDDVTATTRDHPSFIIIVASYGMDAVEACPANGHRAFGEAMRTWGAGAGLDAWTDIGPSGGVSAPSGESPLFGYILIGANDMEPGTAVESFLDGGILNDATYLARADAQMRPEANEDGSKMIFTPAAR